MACEYFTITTSDVRTISSLSPTAFIKSNLFYIFIWPHASSGFSFSMGYGSQFTDSKASEIFQGNYS